MGLTKNFAYNDRGQLTAVELPAVADPDNAGQLTRPRYEYGYDVQGNQTLIRDPLGHETWFTFDQRGQQLTRTLPLGFGADGVADASELSTLNSPLSTLPFTERFEYDDLGRQTVHVSFEGVVTQFLYDDPAVDAAGNITVPGTGRLLEKRFFSDEAAYASGNGMAEETWTYQYDAFGRQVEVTQTDGVNTRTVQNGYDSAGRLSVVDSPEGIIGYSFDDVGRKTATKVWSAGADPTNDTPDVLTTYSYDALGRLKTVVEDLDPSSTLDTPLSTSYGYELAGSLDRTDLPNGVVEDYVYDELGRLDVLTHYAPDATPVDLSDNAKQAEFDYTLRADGKRTAATETFWLDSDSDGVSEPHVNQINWTYDDVGRLTDEVFNHFDDTLDQTEHFVYDLTGNRKLRTKDIGNDTSVDESTVYTYDANDRLIDELFDSDNDGTPDQTTTHGYDHTQQSSKTVTDSVSNFTLHSSNFSYDLQGRMAVVKTEAYESGTLASRKQTTFDYDSTGIRIGSADYVDTVLDPATDNFALVTETQFLVDHHNFTGYQQVIRETHSDANGDVVKTVEYTFGHDEIAQTTTEFAGGEITSATTLTFGHDGHGSVRVLYDAVAAITQVFSYEAYGSMLGIHDVAGQFISADEAAALTVMLYSGEPFVQQVAMQYLRARFYESAAGRFNQLDPFAGNKSDPLSLHKYAYVHGDPIHGVDPSGLFSVGSLLMSMGVAGGIGAGLGAIHAWLGDEGAAGIAWGAASGFGFGAIAGAAVFFAPGFMAGSFMLGFGMGLSVPFAAQSFAAGKSKQGYFRIFTGIAVPLALRNAALRRLANSAVTKALTPMKGLFSQIRGRTNSQLAHDDSLGGLAGSMVDHRIPINADLPPGDYIYVFDVDGNGWALPADATVTLNGTVLEAKHSSMLPRYGRAPAAGKLRVNPDKTVDLNAESGHFMRDDPIGGAVSGDPNEERVWVEVLTGGFLHLTWVWLCATLVLDLEIYPIKRSPAYKREAHD